MKKKKKLYSVVFTTRKSFSFYMILIFLIFMCLSLFIIYLKESMFMKSFLAFFIACLSITFLFNNKIVLEGYFIRIYFGIFIIKIKYKDIKGLYKVENHLPSIASSSYRVGIKTNSLSMILFDTFVSPMDRDDFIYEVNRRL